MPARTALVLALLGLSACEWVEASSVDRVAWSDDGVRQAWVESGWQFQKSLFALLEAQPTRHRHQHIFVRDVPGGPARDLTGERVGAQFLSLFDMHSAGYVLAVDQDAHGQHLRQYAGGQAHVLAERGDAPDSCGVFDGIPSPDGLMIAVLERHEPAPAAPAAPSGPHCRPGRASVRFLDAATRAVLAGPFEWDVEHAVAGAWNDRGAFLVTEAPSRRAWLVDRATGPAPAAFPACSAQATTSGPVSAAGVEIGPGTPEEPVRLLRRGAVAFGCR
jgi:hypothetical protein